MFTAPSPRNMDPSTPMQADYDSNSAHQLAGNMRNVQGLTDCLLACPRQRVLHLADFGSATGLNSMKVFTPALQKLRETDSTPVVVHHVDLPGNEWGVLFNNFWQAEESYGRLEHVYPAAVGGSMFKRLFPDDFLSIVYSSFALHWLSDIVNLPPTASEEEIEQAVLAKSQSDLDAFLTARLAELQPQGFIIIRTSTFNSFRGAFDHCFAHLTAAGLIPSACHLKARNRVRHRTLADYQQGLQKFEGRLKVVEARDESFMNPVYEEYLRTGDKEKFADRMMMGLKAVSTSSFQMVAKAYNLDANVVLPAAFELFREYFRGLEEPVFVPEVLLILQKT